MFVLSQETRIKSAFILRPLSPKTAVVTKLLACILDLIPRICLLDKRKISSSCLRPLKSGVHSMCIISCYSGFHRNM